MKRSLLLAVSVVALAFQMACGPAQDTQSEVAGLDGVCSFAPLSSANLPKLPKPTGFKTTLDSPFYRGGAIHRARDVIARKGQDAILHAKFAYKLLDKDMKNVPVDIYLNLGCTSGFKKVGTAVTSKDDENGTIENVKDSGGRIFTKLSALGLRNLPLGRHRILYVVPADNSYTESFLDIVEADAKYVVSDIDGTLTSSEFAAVNDVFHSVISKVKGSAENKGASDVLKALQAKGYRIFYLTARPEWLMPITREWLRDHKFPEGTIHTTDKKSGAQGDAAMNYKIAEITLLKDQTGIVPTYAFGNKPSDVEAFGRSGIPAANSFYFKLKGDAKGGVIHSDYTTLVPLLNKAENVSH